MPKRRGVGLRRGGMSQSRGFQHKAVKQHSNVRLHRFLFLPSVPSAQRAFCPQRFALRDPRPPAIECCVHMSTWGDLPALLKPEAETFSKCEPTALAAGL